MTSPTPHRRVPRAFSLPWGRGQILEEAALDEGIHEPAIQLLFYELGEKKGLHAIRFAAYDEDGRIEQRPLIINERELAGLKQEIDRSPRLKALLRRLIED